MITSTLVTSVSITSPTLVFTSTDTGAPEGGSVVGQVNAITTMALCNVGTVVNTNETTNAVVANIYLVKKAASPDTVTFSNVIVSKLTIPAGETVFFSEERIVLDIGDKVYIGTNVSGDGILAVTVSTLPV